MFFEKLLNKIPYFRNRRIAKMKRDLVEIGKDFADTHFNDKYVVNLHNIVNSPLISFSDDIVSRSIGKLTTYTKTSVSAVKLLESKTYKQTSIERSNLMSTNKSTIYFSEWYSNEESVLELVELLRPYLQVQAWMHSNPGYESQEQIDAAVSDLIDAELFDSLLYRYLLEDLVSIISFYLENQYE